MAAMVSKRLTENAPRPGLMLRIAGRVAVAVLLVLLSVLLLLALPHGADAQGRAEPRARDACSALPREDAIAAIASDGGVALAGGDLLRLADIRLSAPAAVGDDPSADTLAALAGFAGAQVRVSGLGPPDRWSRIPARLDAGLPDASRFVDLAAFLVGRGLAVVDPGPAAQLCNPDLLAIEAAARDDRRGFWSRADSQPISARDIATLTAFAGRFVLVEGIVAAVGERPRATYLDFAGRFAENFTIIIPSQMRSIFQRRGVDLQGLAGRRIRVRGILRNWRGPALDLTAPDILEILDLQSPPR